MDIHIPLENNMPRCKVEYLFRNFKKMKDRNHDKMSQDPKDCGAKVKFLW